MSLGTPGHGPPTARAVHVFADLPDLAVAVAARVEELLADAIAARGVASVALSGGSTPRSLHAALVRRARVDWERVKVFFGDERCVPPEHKESNYGMARDTLLHPAGVADKHVFRMRGEAPPEEAAADYEAVLARELPGDPASAWPRLDVVLLGMGPDGHTASLFPGTAVLAEMERAVAAPFVDKIGVHRITLTVPVLCAARAAVYMIAGADKAAPLAEVLHGTRPAHEIPTKLVRPDLEGGRLELFVDEAAHGAGHPVP